MSGDNLRDLENETAEALLNAIKKDAGSYGPAQLEQLANAYAAIVAAAPGPKKAPARAVVG
jgi:hypothetical protein